VVEQEQNSFEAVCNCAWHSSPITVLYPAVVVVVMMKV
jgi:hypothetical protein